MEKKWKGKANEEEHGGKKDRWGERDIKRE